MSGWKFVRLLPRFIGWLWRIRNDRWMRFGFYANERYYEYNVLAPVWPKDAEDAFWRNLK